MIKQGIIKRENELDITIKPTINSINMDIIATSNSIDFTINKTK